METTDLYRLNTGLLVIAVFTDDGKQKWYMYHLGGDRSGRWILVHWRTHEQMLALLHTPGCTVVKPLEAVLLTGKSVDTVMRELEERHNEIRDAE